MIKKIIISGIVFVILILGVIAMGSSEIALNFSQDQKDTLKKVGKGIGNINKTRQLFDENGTNFANQTYTDKLKRFGRGCDNDFCHFNLFQEGGINKDFKVKLEQVCDNFENVTDEFGSFLNCTLWRAETDEEVLEKAEGIMEQVLERIIEVTEAREEVEQELRFKDVNITI